jgi:hypothetical protein
MAMGPRGGDVWQDRRSDHLDVEQAGNVSMSCLPCNLTTLILAVALLANNGTMMIAENLGLPQKS